MRTWVPLCALLHACVRQGVALCRGVPFCSHPLDYARVMSAAIGDIGDVRQTHGKKGRWQRYVQSTGRENMQQYQDFV